MLEIIKKENKKRVGILRTKSGETKTPFFMPDATRGFAKSLSGDDLGKMGMGPMVVNTYHLYLQPGMDVIRKAQGINKFMNYERPLLSDSGGYQVFSLIHKNPKLGRVTDDEVIFRSPADGSKHILTPEKAIDIQFGLGVDMMVCLDDPSPNSYSKEKIEKAVDRTLAWAKRCKDEYVRQIEKRKIEEKNQPLIFGVIQGGEHLDLRKKCAEGLVKIGFDGYGFGARHLDSQGNFMGEVLEYTASLIPENALRFALGVGTPEDIVKCFQMGWDMFDCVIPTREGRHGRLFLRKKGVILSEIASVNDEMESKNSIDKITSHDGEKIPRLRPSTDSAQDGKLFYETININNGKYKKDFLPVNKNCDCLLCKNHTRAYLHHLFSVREPLAMRLASIHNLKFYMDLMKKLREG